MPTAGIINGRQTPTDLAEAIERIHQLEDALGVGFTIDPRVGLTRREEQILGVLVSAQGVVTPDRLFTVLYGMDDNPPDYKTIQVLICYLRRKLRARGIEIVTVHSRGYFVDDQNRTRARALQIEAA